MSNYGRAYTTINGTAIKSCRSRGVDRRVKTFSGGFDGTLHQTMHNGQRTAPLVSFGTLDIGAILDLLTNLETPMVALNGSTGLNMVWPKGASAAPGDFAGNVHHSEIMAAGAVYLDEISWSSSDVAEATCSALGINTTGLTDPVQASDTAAAPTALYPDVAYTTTAFTVSGADPGEVSRISLRIGHGARNDEDPSCYLKGLPHPTRILHPGAGGQIAMTLEFETNDLVVPTLGNIVWTLAPLTVGGIGTSGTSRTLTMVPGLLVPGALTDGNPSRRSWRALLRHDGTNRPLTKS